MKPRESPGTYSILSIHIGFQFPLQYRILFSSTNGGPYNSTAEGGQRPNPSYELSTHLTLKKCTPISGKQYTLLIPSLILLDQSGFLLGREARDNILIALNSLHWLTKTSIKVFFLSIDNEKAFNRVAWDYMEAVLKTIGLQWDQARLPSIPIYFCNDPWTISATPMGKPMYKGITGGQKWV